jgi:hypothetical protein
MSLRYGPWQEKTGCLAVKEARLGVARDKREKYATFQGERMCAIVSMQGKRLEKSPQPRPVRPYQNGK